MAKYKRNYNISLILGALILCFLFSILLFGDFIRTTDPYSIINTQVISKDTGEATIIRPPFAPSREYYFGTDELGRDIFSQLIYGAKFTMKIVFLSVFIRLLVALPLGYGAGFGNKFSREIVSQASLISTALPALIINYLVLNLELFKRLELEPSIVAFALVIGITEWGRLGKLIQGKVEELLRQPFITDGDKVIGKTQWQIAIKSVLPHLFPFLAVFAALEISRALIMLMQLGVFSVFLGSRSFDSDTLNMLIGRKFSYEPEWSAIMADAPKIINANWWIVVFPALAFFISILGFNLFGEGLREEFEKEDSRIYYYIRKTLEFISPKYILIDMRERHTRKLLLRLIIVMMIFALPIVTRYESPLTFDGQNAYTTLQSISKNNSLAGAYTGSTSIQNKRAYLIKTLEELGISGYSENNYLQTLPGDGLILVDDIELTINIDNSSETYHMKNGIIPYAYSEQTVEDSIVVLPSNIDFPPRGTQAFWNLESEYRSYEGKVLVVNNDLGGVNDIINYLRTFLAYAVPKAIIVIDENAPDVLAPFSIKFNDSLFGNIPIVFINEPWGNLLLHEDNRKVSLKMTHDPIDHDISNIIAVIPGSDPQLKEEIILVGVPYDSYITTSGHRKYGALTVDSGLAVQMEILKALSSYTIKPKRTLGFVFWDASLTPKSSGASDFIGLEGLLLKHTHLYISLGPMGYKGNDKVVIDASTVSNVRPMSQGMSENIKKIAQDMKLKITSGQFGTKEAAYMYRNGYPSLSIYSHNAYGTQGTSQDVLESVELEQLQKMGQLVLDSIIKLAY